MIIEVDDNKSRLEMGKTRSIIIQIIIQYDVYCYIHIII